MLTRRVAHPAQAAGETMTEAASTNPEWIVHAIEELRDPMRKVTRPDLIKTLQKLGDVIRLWDPLYPSIQQADCFQPGEGTMLTKLNETVQALRSGSFLVED